MTLMLVMEVFVAFSPIAINWIKGSMAKVLCYEKRGRLYQFNLSIPSFTFRGEFINILLIT